MNKKRVLITGGAGFIGFHLANKLAEEGHFVIGLDNFNSYYPVYLKNARRDQLQKLGVEVIKGDINDSNKVTALLDEHKITHIAHMAAQAGVRYSLDNPQSYVESNLKGFISILEALKTRPSIKLIFASSSSVYGRNKKTPFAVEDTTDSQASLYGATKKAGELFAHTYHHLYGLTCIGLRFFTVYGPWGRPDMAYWTFSEKIVQGMPLPLFNEGKMRRDFTYIDDIVQGIIKSLDREGFALYNLGNHKPVELIRFVEILERLLGKKALLQYLPMQPGDVEQTYADITQSQTDLEFNPSTSLEEGLEKFTFWLQNTHKNPTMSN